MEVQKLQQLEVPFLSECSWTPVQRWRFRSEDFQIQQLAHPVCLAGLQGAQRTSPRPEAPRAVVVGVVLGVGTARSGRNTMAGEGKIEVAPAAVSAREEMMLRR